MNEKSNPMPMMYKTIPAVAELNKVPGFDPLKFLRHKVSRKTNEEMLQLELPYQKLWFRLRHPQGRMKLTTLRITEQLAIMEARVYLDRSDAEPIQLKKDRVIIHTGHLAGKLLVDVLMADLMENTDSIQSPALAAAA